MQIQKREVFGKAVRRLREAGFLPGELYGGGKENIHVSVPLKDFLKVYKEAGENTLVTLVLDGERLPVLIYDVQRDSLSGKIVHADFYQVRMDEKIKTRIPLEFAGEPPAVKEKIGILVKAMQELEVEALPADLPHRIEINLDTLDEVGKSFYVKDLKQIPGVEFLAEPETVIASISAMITEEEEAKMAETPAVEEIKVEGEEKVEARQKEKTETEEKAE